MAENPHTPLRPELTEYESTFMCNSERFLSTYQNTLASAWSSTDIFFINFKKVALPSELYYRLWLFVAKVRVTIMVSYSLIRSKGPKPFSLDGATSGYIASEMIFLSEAMGHVGRALNILVIMRVASVAWRDLHGLEYDLTADMLFKKVDKSIDDWVTRAGNVFGLSFFDREGLFDRINHEMLYLKLALYVEHGFRCARKLEILVKSYVSQANTNHWDFMDLCSYMVGASEVAISLENRGEEIFDPRWIKFRELIREIKATVPDFLERKKAPLDISSLDGEHTLLHVSSTLRMVVFNEFDQYLVMGRDKVRLVHGFSFAGFPFEGLPLLSNRPALITDNHFEHIAGVPINHDRFIHVGPGIVDTEYIELYRYYAAMKSPVHLMALYGGLIFTTISRPEKTKVFVFDKGADILYRHPAPLKVNTRRRYSLFGAQTPDFQLTKEETRMRSGVEFPEQETLSVRESEEKELLSLFTVVTVLRSAPSDVYVNEGFVLWDLCCLESEGGDMRSWKPESVIGKFMILSEQSREDWNLKNNISRPKLLVYYKELANPVTAPDEDDARV